ncbi:MAG: TAT-variant-translocated molybdopterin oxidoreductase, partial [Bacteroidota bacterium]
MKKQINDIWVGIPDKTNDPKFMEQANQEFIALPIVETLSDEKKAEEITTNRRDFLKYLGFGLGAATVAAGCEIPVRRAIPYVVKPDAIVPGVATYYASSFVKGGDFCSVLVKTREGRPIKIEGNDMSAVTMGGTSARAQASVLSLYDTARFRGPQSMTDGEMTDMSWADLDKAVKSKLASGNAAIITNTVLSPTAKKAMGEFMAKYPNAKVVTYDPVSSAAILLANEQAYGDKVIPNYRFDKADIIVSFGADFLGTWISPIEYAAQYAKNRKIKNVKKAKMSRHVQVESGMSLTGSNADNRVLIKPSEMGAAIATLYNEVAKATGGTTIQVPALNDKAKAALTKVARELVGAKGKSLLVSASNNIGEQLLIAQANELLGNVGSTVDFAEASMQRQGNEQEVQSLITDMARGGVNTVLVMGANPAYDLPNSAQFSEAFAKCTTRVFMGETPNETAMQCTHVAPTHHYLESWGDAEPKRGHLSLIQPTIAPLFATRQGEESLLVWAESANYNATADQPYYEYVKANWQSTAFTQQSAYAGFQSFWDNALHNGVLHLPAKVNVAPEAAEATAPAAAGIDVAAAAAKVSKPSASDLEIAFYETINIGAGEYANNPWLMEMPDPVMRTVWGNYLSLPISFDGVRDFNTLNDLKTENDKADLTDVSVGGVTHRMTAYPQFGQQKQTVSVALGYGREAAGKCGTGIGQNVYPWLTQDDDKLTQYYAEQVEVSGKVGTEEEYAAVQFHHTLGVTGTDAKTGETINADEAAAITITAGLFRQGWQGGLTDRSIIFHGDVKEIDTFVHDLEEKRAEYNHLNEATLYPYEEFKENVYELGHHWGLHIDLNACTGCAACTIACIAENNVPVVGKTEVHRHHEMTWLRIDRYFYGDVDNPNTVYQPMMCQHCDNAPCENVCPVAATNHSAEGLNQMTYNRCIGTRYCANNCPYKVRRFLRYKRSYKPHIQCK